MNEASPTAPALRMWIEFFDDLQNIRGRSLNTVMAYRRDLEIWEDYRRTHKDVLGFFEFMKGRGLSTRSQARVISSLRTYFRFLEAQGLAAPELRELRPPKVKAGLPKSLSAEEFQRLYDAAESESLAKTARNRITLLLLYGLGCRVSELISLNLSDFNETDQWLSIFGKGGKERAVPLTKNLAGELRAYLVAARPQLLKDATEAVLINDRGRRPSRVDVWRWLATWSTKAGFAEPVNPHRFRHGCATALLESGADLRSIQVLLGHASIQTTQIYTAVAGRTLVETIAEHHPMSGLESRLDPDLGKI
ncbi:MAG: tyrosine-type recombinase/integrase [Deltaproteobacteria bacterium]|nr:tyrosine-type recombinase/integrase [Deltaproteobacteria bacterium]